MNYHNFDILSKVKVIDYQNFIDEFINVDGRTYAILPVLIAEFNGSLKYYTFSKQFIITNKITGKKLFYFVERALFFMCNNYSFDVKSLDGLLIFKFRHISMDLDVYNKVKNIIKISDVENISNFKDISFVDDCLPNSNNKSYYGTIIENKDLYINDSLVKGIHYQYKENVIIVVQEKDLNTRKLLVFKDGVKYDEC